MQRKKCSKDAIFQKNWRRCLRFGLSQSSGRGCAKGKRECWSQITKCHIAYVGNSKQTRKINKYRANNKFEMAKIKSEGVVVVAENQISKRRRNLTSIYAPGMYHYLYVDMFMFVLPAVRVCCVSVCRVANLWHPHTRRTPKTIHEFKSGGHKQAVDAVWTWLN